MSDTAKVAKLEAKINEIVSRPTYPSTPAWRQEVAELRIQIQALQSGRDVERREYERLTVDVAGGGAAVIAPLSPAHDMPGDDDEAELEGEHEEEHHANYGGVFVGLAVLTLLEWKLAKWFGVTGVVLWITLTVMAVVKALMVAAYFMHLSTERKTVYVLLTIPVILVAVMVTLLIPDARQQVYDYLTFMMQ